MIERSSEAILDLATHILYLHEKAGPETSLRFVDAVENALNRLEKHPHLGRIQHFRQAGLRSWMVPGFHHWLIFYLPVEKGIRVYRLINAAMDLETQLGTE